MTKLGELPEGRRGQLLAAGLLLLLLAALWAGLVSPLADWFAARDEAIGRQAVLAQHMERIAADLPALRLAAAASAESTPVAVLDGSSDAVAGAALQGRLQQIGGAVGASLASTEVLAGEPVGRFRRIGVRVAVVARWSNVVRLLGALAADPTRLMVNDLQIQSQRSSTTDADPVLNVSMVVFGFRAAETPAP